MEQGKTRNEPPSAKQALNQLLQRPVPTCEPEQTIPRAPRSGPLPASYAQQRLWFFDQLSPGNPMYNMYEAFRLSGSLDSSLLEQSLSEIIRRHEVLRTSFDCIDGKPVQVIQEKAQFRLQIVDLQHPPNPDRKLQRLLQEEATKPFAVGRVSSPGADQPPVGRVSSPGVLQPLMLRATLYQLKPDDHVLLLGMHHIASDGWSLGILFHELSVLYDYFQKNGSTSKAFDLHEQPPLPELPIQYADFALWQRREFESGALESQLAFWRKQLAGAPSGLEFPTDHPRPPVQTFRGNADSIALPVNLASALKTLSRKSNLTLYMTLLAAVKTLVYRYSRQTDIVIGTPIAGRNQLETENLIGFFINTLALRTDLSGNPTFRELLNRVRQTTLDAFTNQDVPFDELVSELQPERSSSHSPFFQILFATQNVAESPLAFPGISVSRIAIPNGTSKFDLTFMATDHGQELSIDVEYNRDLYEPGTISRMLGHFKTLLEAIAANPDQRISELPLLTEPERTQLLVEWNATARDFPRDKTVAQLFEEQTLRTPDTVAINSPLSPLSSLLCISYRQLNARANQLAHALQAKGVHPGACVGIYLERGPELIISLLAVAKAGAAYLPLDRAYPPERIAFMLADAKAPLVITQRKLLQNLGTVPDVLCLDTDADFIQRQPETNPVSSATGESLAYIIYTSGSTGQPKGACVPHRAINRLVINTDYVRLQPSDVIAQVSNTSFDAATFEVWGALLNGAKLVIFENDILLNPAGFARHLREQGVTTIFLTTALFNLMARENPAAFKGLRTLIVGGEALDPGCIAAVLRADPPERLLNGYGPTETTTFAVCYEIKTIPDESRGIPIGRPIANTTTYILDDRMQPVPVGVPGELYIGGPGVTCGYLNRPDLTRDKFIPSVGRTVPGEPYPLYKTGDLARYLPDGNIEFLGRLDSQIKIRGFRVELGEIETVLARHPAVRQCAVLLHQEPGMAEQKSLVAYVSIAEGYSSKGDLAATLREHLGATLPDYMLPSEFIVLPALPLNANGKIDRRALPSLKPSDPSGPARKQVPPRDELEQQLVQIWEKVLHRHPIGITDQFFQLGGHSLLAVKLIVEIEATLQKRIPVSMIFQFSTIEQLAAVLRKGETVETVEKNSIVEIQPHGDKPPIFLVHGVGGGMFWGYQNLSRYLGETQPVYVIKSRAMDGGEEFKTVEEMAAYYCEELLKFITARNITGPLILGGYCFGGNVAYEMARQLTAHGKPVGLLALMNCAPPNSSYIRVRWTPGYLMKFFKNLSILAYNFLQWPATQRNDFLKWKLRLLSKSLLGKRASGNNLVVEELVDLSNYTEQQRKLWETHIQALVHYHPGKYSGAVTLFRARAHAFLCSFDPLCGWGELAEQGVDVNVVSGPHEGILDEPHVQKVAVQLKKCLEAVRTKHDGNPTNNGEMYPELSKLKKRSSSSSALALLALLFLGVLGFASSERNKATTVALAAAAIVARPRRTRSIPKAPAASSYPLSFAQERLFFLAQLDPEFPAHNLPQAMRLRGWVDLQALRKSLNLLLRRHPALRTQFKINNGEAVEFVSPAGELKLPIIDLRGVPEPDKEMQKLAREEARRGFDLEKDLMVRAVLFRLADDNSVLLVTFHRLAADARSGEIFWEELTEGYAGAVTRRELGIEYRDYAVWQRREDYDFSFWKEKLAGAPRVLELPSDRPRPAVQSGQGTREPVELGPELTEALTRLGREASAPLYTVLLAGFQTLLVRYSGREDLLVGAPVDNREQEELQHLIGPLQNTLVVRANASGDPTFMEFLERTRDWVNAAFEHGDIPFERLIDELNLKRDRSVHPLVQVMFAFRGPSWSPKEAGGLTWEWLDFDPKIAQCDLALEFRETNHGLACWFEYASDLFAPGRMVRMAANFKTLLQGIAANPNRRLSELPLLSEPERKLVIEAWNRTEMEYPQEQNFIRLFEQQAAFRPESEALVFGEQRLTYHELHKRANMLAQELRRLGVGPEIPVAVCLDRKPEMVIAILGVLKAGGAYVPMDPAYPAERLAFMLEDSGTGILVTERKFLQTLPVEGVNVVCMDEEKSAIVDPLTEDVCAGAPNNLAYILYTSGSTGRPKGVAVEHRSITAFMHWAHSVYSPQELAGVLFVTSPCFDVSVFEMFVPLAWGGKVILGENALEWMRSPTAREVTLISAVPSLVAEWLREGGLPDSLRTVNMAGEPVPQTVVDKIYEQYPQVQRVYDLYGPTEATVYATFAWRKPAERYTIGRPLANQQVYLLDAHGQPVPIGVPGEMHIGGAGLARGYWGQPDLTAERFIPNPFHEGEKLYKTGDLARFYEDGTLEYLGRIDHQVKVRGHRIELGEIEARLRQHSGVADVVVTVREDQPGDKRLVAYVVEKQPSSTSQGEGVWRSFLKQKLPDFMVPSRFVILPALPRNPNGKLDRKALPVPARGETEQGYVAPQSQAEVLLVGIWSEVLGRENVGVHQNFFELGGHSLMIMQMLARVRDRVDVELPMRAVFDAPTVAGLAQVIEEVLMKEIDQLSEEEARQMAESERTQ